jgi:hypothetical protein
VALTFAGAAAAGQELHIRAPASHEEVTRRIERIDRARLAAALARAGLAAPPDVDLLLVPEANPEAAATPRWIVGRAHGLRDIVIFPDRVPSYPYDSLEGVVQHEIVHLALANAAHGRPLPRWFHEGVAVSVETGWRATDGLRLAIAMLAEPTIADLDQLFQSESESSSAQAYLLAAALIEDLRSRHGQALPGAVAARVARDVPFPEAFTAEAGETPEEAAARAWAGYRRWTTWAVAITSPLALWSGVMALAFVALLVRLRRRMERRRLWEVEDAAQGDPGPRSPAPDGMMNDPDARDDRPLSNH